MATNATTDLIADPEVITGFLRDYLGESIHLVAIVPDGHTEGRWFADDVQAATTWAVEQNGRGKGVYWTVNLVTPGIDKKPLGGKEDPDNLGDMVGHRFLHVDIDPPKDGTQFNLIEAQRRLAGLRFPPSFTIATGGGIGAFWRLDEAVANKRVVTGANIALERTLQGDHCHNHDRLMRVPGTVNWPNRKKAAAGRKPAMAAVLEQDDGVVYPLHALAAEFPAPARDDRKEAGSVQLPEAVTYLTADDLGLGVFDPLRSLIDRPAGRDRSGDAFACAGEMHRAGYTDAQIAGVLLNPANAVHAHLRDQRDPRYQAMRCIEGTRPSVDRQQETGPVGDAKGNARSLLPMLDPGDWFGVEVPPREWMAHEWMPKGSCTYLTGLGATGKSLLTQQFVTCAAMGIDFLGVEVRQCVSIYITCEDDAAELQRRQDSINAALGITMKDLHGKLVLVSLKGMQNNELCTFDALGRMSLTDRWHSILATLQHIRAGFVALDNVAHLFAGNENIRNQVAAFTGLMDRLAQDIDGGVLLLGHPNKAGAEFSGSTAWENQVRSRIYLALPEGEDGIVDPDARTLTRSKPNYARRGEALSFLWHKWAFVRLDDLPKNTADALNETIAVTTENARFLECLAVRTQQKRTVSENKASPTFAPREFAKMTEARGLSKAKLERAMERLFSTGQIERGELPWEKSRGHVAEGLRLTYGSNTPKNGGNPASDPSASHCASPASDVGENGGNACGQVRLTDTPYIHISGAAHMGAAPLAESRRGAGWGKPVFAADGSINRPESHADDNDANPAWDDEPYTGRH
jgi:RecA-family ATPase